MGFCMKVWKSPRMSRPHGVPTAQERKLPQVGTHCLQDLQENAVRSPPKYQVVDRFLASLPVRRASSVCQVPPWGHVRSRPHIMPSLGHGPPSQSPTTHTPGPTAHPPRVQHLTPLDSQVLCCWFLWSLWLTTFGFWGTHFMQKMVKTHG